MQRVVSINLNGNAYQVEENGYNALFAYLDAVESSFNDHPDRAQKLAELERVIAGKCEATLGPHKTVVTSADVDRILLEVDAPPGQPPPDPSSSASSSASSSSSSASPSSTPSSSPSSTSGSPSGGHRRLFQIREGAMISGVCVGLSEFLHIDVTLIRVMFVVLAFVTAGWGMLAYGVLMVVVPKVNTRAEASGGTATGPLPPHRWPWDDGRPWDQPREQRRQWRAERRAARMQCGPASGTIGIIFFLLIGFFWMSFWTRGRFFFGFPFFWGFPHWIGIVFFFVMLRLIFMPFRIARGHGYGHGPYGPYDHPHYAWASMWNGLAWFVVVIFAVWAAYHYIPDVHDFLREFQTSFRDGIHV